MLYWNTTRAESSFNQTSYTQSYTYFNGGEFGGTSSTSSSSRAMGFYDAGSYFTETNTTAEGYTIAGDGFGGTSVTQAGRTYSHDATRTEYTETSSYSHFETYRTTSLSPIPDVTVTYTVTDSDSYTDSSTFETSGLRTYAISTTSTSSETTSRNTTDFVNTVTSGWMTTGGYPGFVYASTETYAASNSYSATTNFGFGVETVTLPVSIETTVTNTYTNFSTVSAFSILEIGTLASAQRNDWIWSFSKSFGGITTFTSAQEWLTDEANSAASDAILTFWKTRRSRAVGFATFAETPSGTFSRAGSSGTYLHAYTSITTAAPSTTTFLRADNDDNSFSHGTVTAESYRTYVDYLTYTLGPEDSSITAQDSSLFTYYRSFPEAHTTTLTRSFKIENTGVTLGLATSSYFSSHLGLTQKDQYLRSTSSYFADDNQTISDSWQNDSSVTRLDTVGLLTHSYDPAPTYFEKIWETGAYKAPLTTDAPATNLNFQGSRIFYPLTALVSQRLVSPIVYTHVTTAETQDTTYSYRWGSNTMSFTKAWSTTTDIGGGVTTTTAGTSGVGTFSTVSQDAVGAYKVNGSSILGGKPPMDSTETVFFGRGAIIGTSVDLDGVRWTYKTIISTNTSTTMPAASSMLVAHRKGLAYVTAANTHHTEGTVTVPVPIVVVERNKTTE